MKNGNRHFLRALAMAGLISLPLLSIAKEKPSSDVPLQGRRILPSAQTVDPINTFPYNENFNTAAGWTVTNPDNNYTFALGTIGANSVAYINYWNYSGSGQEDFLASPIFDFTSQVSGTVSFDLDKASYPSAPDRLAFEMSTDGGATWGTTYFDATDPALSAPLGGSNNSPYTNPIHWHTYSFALTAGALASNNVQFRFHGYNGFGNYLFIDNFVVSAESWHSNVSNTGPGGSGAWSPTLPNDPGTNNVPAAGVTFPPNGGGSNPTQITIRYDSIPNVAAGWGVNVPEMNAALPPASSVNRIWEVNQTGGTGFSATLELNFTAADLPAAITDPVNQIHFAWMKHDPNPWVAFPCVVTGPVSGVYTATITGVTTFSLWGLGVSGVLPVELSAFSATSTARGVNLYWRTESESNNSHFTVERWKNGDANNIKTVRINSLTRNGNSNTALAYRFNDTDPLTAGAVYNYRLSEVSLNGEANVLRTTTVTVLSFGPAALPLTENLLSAYPNPFNPTTTIKVQMLNAQQSKVALYDVTGKKVKDLYSGVIGREATSIKVDARDLASGVYYVRVSGNVTLDQKLVLMK